MKLKLVIILSFLFPLIAMAQQDTSTITRIGDNVPSFSFEIEKSKTVSINDYKGRLILINLFATWCGPCNMELPVMQKQVWEKYGTNPQFALFVFGREEGWEKLNPYKEKKGFSFPILPDVDRGIFKKFARVSIPRNIIVDETGKIIYQSIGYSPEEFDKMVKLIAEKLR